MKPIQHAHQRKMAYAVVLVLAAFLGACQPGKDASAHTLEVRITDHRVAIGDFETLNVTLASIDLHPRGQPRTTGWLNYVPQTIVLDLTQYLDGREATVLSAALPAGEYDAIRLVLTGAEGALKSGETAFIDGFSQAAALRFTAPAGRTTIILLDLVVESADDHPGGDYSMNMLNAEAK